MAFPVKADFFSLRGGRLVVQMAWLRPFPLASSRYREGSFLIFLSWAGERVRFSSLRRRARLKEEKRTEKKFSAPAYFHAER